MNKAVDYEVRVHKMDEDFKRTRNTFSALTKRVEEMQKEKETLQTENVSVTKQDEERVTKYMHRIPTTIGGAKKHPHLSSLTLPNFGFSKDLEKAIGTSTRLKVLNFKMNSKTFSPEWKGPCEAMQDTELSPTEAFNVLSFSPTVLAKAPPYFLQCFSRALHLLPGRSGMRLSGRACSEWIMLSSYWFMCLAQTFRSNAV